MVYTVKKLAARYEVSEDTIRRAINNKRLIAAKPGGSKTGYRIDEADAKTWWESTKK